MGKMAHDIKMLLWLFGALAPPCETVGDHTHTAAATLKYSHWQQYLNE